ncbi:hypothetical protein WIW49_08855 [Xanthomonas euroxanthea]
MLLDQCGFTETDVPNQAGKCFVVTGANAGVGFEISRVLAARARECCWAVASRAGPMRRLRASSG